MSSEIVKEVLILGANKLDGQFTITEVTMADGVKVNSEGSVEESRLHFDWSIDRLIEKLVEMKEKGPGDFVVEVSVGAIKDSPPNTFLTANVYNYDAYMKRGKYAINT